MPRLVLAVLLLCLPALAAAAEKEARFDIDSDSYMAGGSVTFSGPEGTDDLYMAGEDTTVAAALGGSAHVAGRRVHVTAPVGDALYAVGFDVEVSGAVGADASVAGYSVDVSGPVAGDLRAAGSEVTLDGDVAGYALLTGERVSLGGSIGGDAVIAARKLAFGPDATVAGALTVYAENPGAVEVPARVAPPERVTVKALETFDRGAWRMRGPVPSTAQIVGGFLMGVLVTGLFAAVVSAVAPEAFAAWRATAAARPGRALVSGFLVASMLSGSVIVLVFTLVGVLLVPFVFFLTWLVLFCGYALGAYVIGAWVWRTAGRAMPEGFWGRFGVATLGAFLTALAWLVPVLGWFFVMGLTLVGVGALAAHVLPRNLLLHA